MRRLEILVAQCRRVTENRDVAGIGNDEIVQYFNDAQDRLQSRIQQEHPQQDYFARQGYINLISQQDAYDLTTLLDESGASFTSQILLSNAISLVERSNTQGDTFIPLKFISSTERRTGWGYFFRDNYIVIAPLPVSGQIRITYTRRLNNLDIRRGSIQAVNSGISIGLSPGSVPEGTDFANVDYCCVVNKDGTVILGEIPVTGYNQGTRLISTTSALVGVTTDHYVVYGKYSTTNCELDDVAERYLIEYVNMRLYMRDSSRDASAQTKLVDSLEDEIVGLYAEPSNDANQIPILETDYLNY